MKIRGNRGTPRGPESNFRTTLMALLGILLLLVNGCATNREVIPPRRVNSPVLGYPPEAVLQRQSGKLEVRLHLLDDGSIEKWDIQHSTGIPILDAAGMEYIQSLEFLPLVSRGRRQPCVVEQQVIFSLSKPPLDPIEWRKTTRLLIQQLGEAEPAEQAMVYQRLYSQCTDYMSSVITHQNLTMNRMALRLVLPSLREKWALYEDAFPMSFLMFADFAARIEDSPYHERALVNLRQSVEVDLQLLEERLRKREDPALLHMREQLREYLAELQ